MKIRSISLTKGIFGKNTEQFNGEDIENNIAIGIKKFEKAIEHARYF